MNRNILYIMNKNKIDIKNKKKEEKIKNKKQDKKIEKKEKIINKEQDNKIEKEKNNENEKKIEDDKKNTIINEGDDNDDLKRVLINYKNTEKYILKENIKSRINTLDLSDKSICIVCYAGYMYNKSYGTLIDSHDVVCRVNNGINILNINDFGKFTEICVFSFAGGKMKLVRETYNEINNVKYNIADIIKSKELLCISRTKKTTIEESIYNKELIVGLTTGLQAILLILSLKPKSLYITGLSFNNDVYPGYDYFSYKYKKKSFDRKGMSYSDWQQKHSELFEKYIIKKLLEKNINVSTDNEMKEILSNINTSELDNNLRFDKKFIEYFNILEELL